MSCRAFIGRRSEFAISCCRLLQLSMYLYTYQVLYNQCTCVHVCACVCMCVHVCACVCMCVHVCACVCMCLHVDCNSTMIKHASLSGNTWNFERNSGGHTHSHSAAHPNQFRIHCFSYLTMAKRRNVVK